AEAEAAAAEAALLAGAQTEFDAQLSQLEEQLGLLTGPQNQQQGNPFDNVAVTTDNGEDPIRTETQTTIVQINQQIEQTINKIVNIIDKKVEETKKTVEDDVAAAISNIDEWHAGTSGGDTLTGSGQRDGIAGLAGEDIIDGGGGNDVIAGGSGNDNIHGGAGDDFIHGDIPTGTDYEELLSHFSTEIAEDSANPQSTYDDTIYGDAGNDVIDGGLGDDHIYGGADNDTIDGGDGADTIEGGYGDDTIIGDAGNDSLTGNDGDDTIIGGDGEDIIYGNDGQDTIYGSDGADVIEGGNGADTINGGADADTMHGDADNDTIVGDAGDDTLYGDDGDDKLYGSDGADTIYGDGTLGGTETGNDIIHGGDGADTLYGGNGNNILYGDAGNDTLVGGGGLDPSTSNNTLFGGAGEDTLLGATGTKFIDGGDDNDTIEVKSLDNSNGTFSGGSGEDTIDFTDLNSTSITTTFGAEGTGSFSYVSDNPTQPGADSFTGIEKILLSNRDDTVSIDDLSFISTIDAGAGTDDTLALRGTNYNFIGTSQFTNFETLDLSTAATTVTIDANFKSDTGISTINGSGDDTINLSNDWKYSSNSSGFNVYKSTDDTQEIYIQEDITVNDVAYNQPTGTSGMDGSINGTANDDLIWTLGGNDSIFGNDGNDIIAGGSGSDNINGGTGDDTIYGDVPTNSGIAALLYQFFGVVSFLSDIGVAEGDTISDGNGSDTVWAGGGNDVITATEDTDADVFHGEGGALDKLSYSTWTTAGVTMAVTSSGAGSVTNGSVSDTFDGIEYLVGSGQDDQVSIGDLSFISTIDGDAGTDTLALTGTSYNLINTSQITNFETLDLSAAATTLTIDENFVSDTGINTINGSADDSVDLSHGWIYHGSSGGYKTFKTIGEDHTLNISDTITTSNSYYNAVQGTTSPETLTGTTGRDVIWGNDNADSIDGGSGDDVIAGGAGSDIINGGNDDDVIYGDSPASSYDDSSKYLHYNFGDITSGVAADGNDTIDG
ncbi:MAG: calcium-binding protein, partial [Methylocystaceae bacterium]|nr:calcium-binding protein [Methylocystaceae bacterium]